VLLFHLLTTRSSGNPRWYYPQHQYTCMCGVLQGLEVNEGVTARDR